VRLGARRCWLGGGAAARATLLCQGATSAPLWPRQSDAAAAGDWVF
jgi:hypothetical protein